MTGAFSANGHRNPDLRSGARTAKGHRSWRHPALRIAQLVSAAFRLQERAEQWRHDIACARCAWQVALPCAARDERLDWSRLRNAIPWTHPDGGWPLRLSRIFLCGRRRQLTLRYPVGDQVVGHRAADKIALRQIA